MAENITFGAWLKRRRHQLDLTQKGLAFQAGCSVGTIRKIEAVERRPSRQLATLLAQHLEIPPNQLEPFIAFARSEPIAAGLSFPTLAPDEEQKLAIPTSPQEEPVQPLKQNLPSATTPFQGRITELATLDDLLNNLDRHLVTIVGPGGIGKTRLALAYAEQQVALPAPQAHYAIGVFFLNLAPLPDAGRLILTLAETLDIRLQGGTREKRSSRQQLLDYLRDRRLLLILDNFEHLLFPLHLSEQEVEADGAALVAEILQTAPNVQILVTSRERLNLQLEQVVPIEGLPFPDWETAAPKDPITEAIEYPSVQLFLQAARRSLPDYAIETREEISQLVRICRLVAGMPLALELAASWVDTLSLADIAAELKQGLDILETKLRDVPERQRSVRATFDYSWQKLDKKEQTVFAQISIFRGGFTRLAAQAVTGATLRELSQLQNKSFIQFNKQRDRYQVHELLHQFGTDKLGQDSELKKAVQDCHSTYYCQALAQHTNHLKGARKQQAVATIRADIENVRLAWNHALSRQDLVSIGASIESLFRFYWNYQAYLQEGISDFEKAVALLRTGEAIAERGIVLGRMLAVLGWFYSSWHWSISTKAITAATESLDLLRRHGARAETVMPLLCLAGQDTLEESNRLLQESLALAREFADKWAIGDALLRLGLNAREADDDKKAERLWREAFQQFKQNGDKEGAAIALGLSSILTGDCGRYAEALALAREAASLFPESDFSKPAFYYLGMALLDLGAYEEAEEQFQEILAVSTDRDLTFEVDESLFFLGKIAFHMGDYALAAQRYQESLAGALKFDRLDFVAKNHDAMGRLNMAQGSRIQAIEHFQAALRVVISQGWWRYSLLPILASIAELFVEEGDLEYAAFLATLITNHPASQARIKERAYRLLTRLETEIPTGNLANIRQSSRQADLDTVAAQLLLDLKTP